MTKTAISLYLAFLLGAKLHHDDWRPEVGYDIAGFRDVTVFDRTETVNLIPKQPGTDSD